jgi:translation initiation factor 1 (eIF-1/SUI1)
MADKEQTELAYLKGFHEGVTTITNLLQEDEEIQTGPNVKEKVVELRGADAKRMIDFINGLGGK